MKLISKWKLVSVLIGISLSLNCIASEIQALDKTLAPTGETSLSPVFRDMGVVQKKAMKKSGKFLISNYGGLDFSDGPYSVYQFTLNIGYALSDFWEVYVNTVPFFISRPRGIVKDIEGLKLDPTAPEYAETCSGASVCTAQVSFVKPRYQLGAEILWAPAYGKDSIGSHRILRSDTFFKFGVMNTFYEQSQSGIRLHSGVGKTYFLGDSIGFRVAATANLLQTIKSVGATQAPVKSLKFFAIVEAGFTLYL